MQKTPESVSGVFWFLVGDRLGDGLETASRQTKGIRLIDGNSSTDDLGDEVCVITDDPDVTCLVDRESAARVKVGGSLLVAGGRREAQSTVRASEFAHAACACAV